MSDNSRTPIESPGGWLTTVASRICLDLLGSARARRERYVGEWLPEPVPEPARVDHRAAGRHHGRPGRPGHPRRVGQHGLPRRARVHDRGRARARSSCTTSSATPSPKSPRSSAEHRRPAASWPPRPAAASARRGLPRRRQPSRSASSGTSKGLGGQRTSTPSSASSTLTPRRSPTAAASSPPALRPIEGAEQIARHYVDIARRMPSNVTILERTVNGQPGLVAAARRRHRHGVRIRPRRRTDRPCLGGAQPRETPSLDDGLTLKSHHRNVDIRRQSRRTGSPG